MDWKKLGIPVVLVLIAVGFFALYSTTPATIDSSIINDGIKEVGVICVKVTRASGEIEDYGCKRNLVTLLGKHMILNAFNGTWTTTPFSLNYLAIGSNTSALPAQTDTALTGIWNTTCGLGNKTGTFLANPGAGPNAGGSANQSLWATWTNTCASALNVNCTAIANGTIATAASGYAFAYSFFTSAVTLNQNDQLTVNYTWWVQ